MSEGADFDPGPWRGYSFRSARAAYDKHAGRSYDDAVASKVSVDKVVAKSLKTDSKSPLVIACDVTGSMKEWPAVIFEKLPLLDLEIKEYLDGPEISFAAVGDAYSDRYGLQVQKFSSGKDLTDRLKALIIEGGGGGQLQESYDLAALYYARNIEMPKAVKPIFIFIGDEGLYQNVDKEHAKTWAHTNIESKLTSKEVIKELKSKYSVYAIRKLYDVGSSDKMSPSDKSIQAQWEEYVGSDHVVILPEPRRVVDVVLGILAKETSMETYFKRELTERQTPGQVKTVVDALKTIHGPPAALLVDPGKSVIARGTKPIAKTKPLV